MQPNSRATRNSNFTQKLRRKYSISGLSQQRSGQELGTWARTRLCPGKVRTRPANHPPVRRWTGDLMPGPARISVFLPRLLRCHHGITCQPNLHY